MQRHRVEVRFDHVGRFERRENLRPFSARGDFNHSEAKHGFERKRHAGFLPLELVKVARDWLGRFRPSVRHQTAPGRRKDRDPANVQDRIPHCRFDADRERFARYRL